MPFNGSGGYTPAAPPNFPANSGDIIYADRFNNVINDIASALGSVIARDGQSNPSANLPMNNFKHTGASAASASGQYLVYAQANAALGATSFGTGTAPLAGNVVDILGAQSCIRAAAAANAYLEFAGNGNGVGTASLAVGQASNNDSIVWSRHPSGSVVIGTNNTQRFRFDHNGSLFAGATGPSLWGGTFLPFEFTSGVSVAADTSTGTLHLTSNASWNGTNWLYLVNAAAANLFIDRGSLSFRTAVAGTAGNPATFSTKLFINNAGDLIHGINIAQPTLTQNQTFSVFLPSDTQLRFVVRGSDGVTRISGTFNLV